MQKKRCVFHQGSIDERGCFGVRQAGTISVEGSTRERGRAREWERESKPFEIPLVAREQRAKLSREPG